MADPDRLAQLYVRLRDTGVGIPKSDQSKLFRDFVTL